MEDASQYGVAPDRLQQENQELLAELERKKRARKLANVPTDDRKVRLRLRELGEPITLFGEGVSPQSCASSPRLWFRASEWLVWAKRVALRHRCGFGRARLQSACAMNIRASETVPLRTLLSTNDLLARTRLTPSISFAQAADRYGRLRYVLSQLAAAKEGLGGDGDEDMASDSSSDSDDSDVRSSVYHLSSSRAPR